MIEFILNDKYIESKLPSGTLLLDFIRDHQHIKGTKIGCREGDCGACTVMIGTVKDEKINYINATSCLTPIGNIHGKHVVTIEGLNMAHLSPVQQSFIDNSATQCGFCTVGFIVSLTNFCISSNGPSKDEAIAAISGNICRCTGYKSIESAAQQLVLHLKNKDISTPIEWLISHHFIPHYFYGIQDRLKTIHLPSTSRNGVLVGGGTDLYVQRAEELITQEVFNITQVETLRFININSDKCEVGANTTVNEFQNHLDLRLMFPSLDEIFKLFSSAPIRNISTIAGNFVNASPIGDLTAFFMALDTNLIIAYASKKRIVPLKEFYFGYKDIDLKKGEYIHSFYFLIPDQKSHVNLEKVSKRIHLDIASVNTAIQICLSGKFIDRVHLSAGGVGPIPTFLHKTCKYLKGKEMTKKTMEEANEIMQSEISPISDIRGTENYKRLLLRQLFYSHFLKLYPNLISFKSLLQ